MVRNKVKKSDQAVDYIINPDHDIINVEITRAKLVKLLRLNFCFLLICDIGDLNYN
jgi:hypothetical protein